MSGIDCFLLSVGNLTLVAQMIHTFHEFVHQWVTVQYLPSEEVMR